MIKKGVGAACGIKIFRVPIKKSGSIGFGISHIMPKSIESGKESYITQQIEITTLDEFVCEQPLSRLDFIKIDIEGYEWEAFQGMRNTLEKFQPVVMAELDTNLLKRFNADKKQVLALFADMNYEDFLLDEKNGTLEKNRDYPNGDYFFIPRHKIKG